MQLSQELPNMPRQKTSAVSRSGFAERLKLLRQQRNFSQTEWGEMADLHHTHVGRYERVGCGLRGLTTPALSPPLDACQR